MMVARDRVGAVLSLAVLVPAGLATKFYRGPAAGWVAGSLGGVLYEIFWCLAFLAAMPRAVPAATAGEVFLVTCALECLQLWHPPLLEAIRGTFLGAALLGTTFVPSDFGYYAIGCGLGWLWMRGLRRLRDPSGRGVPRTG